MAIGSMRLADLLTRLVEAMMLSVKLFSWFINVNYK